MFVYIPLKNVCSKEHLSLYEYFLFFLWLIFQEYKRSTRIFGS